MSKFTLDTISDSDIYPLLDDPEHGRDARAAVMDPKQHGSLARRVRREARRRIVAVLNARHERQTP